MKLSELYQAPLQEVLQEMELIDFKVHTDDHGKILDVELKYIDTEQNKFGKKVPKRMDPVSDW